MKGERNPRFAQGDRHLHRREREPLVAARQRQSPTAVSERRREVNAVWMPEDNLPRVAPKPGARLEPASERLRVGARQVQQPTVSTVRATLVSGKRRVPTKVAEGRSESHARHPKVPNQLRTPGPELDFDKQAIAVPKEAGGPPNPSLRNEVRAEPERVGVVANRLEAREQSKETAKARHKVHGGQRDCVTDLGTRLRAKNRSGPATFEGFHEATGHHEHRTMFGGSCI